MSSQIRSLLGPAMVLVFCLSQAVRDVYFGSVFQGIDFFLIIFVAFAPSSVVFATVTAFRTPGQLGRLCRKAGLLVALNLTTALAWSCYFFALTCLEPAIVNTIHSGMAPLTVVALGAFGDSIAKPGKIGRSESIGYVGIALTLLALGWVALAASSGLPRAGLSTLAGLAAVTTSGASITVSLLLCKRLHDEGINAEAVTAVRYLGLIAVAVVVLVCKGEVRGLQSAGQLLILTAISAALIVVPLFVMQIGIARTAPLTAHVLRALGPVSVFGAQQLDGRLTYSWPTLICILAYSAAAVAATVAHTRPPRPRSAKSFWKDRVSPPQGAARSG